MRWMSFPHVTLFSGVIMSLVHTGALAFHCSIHQRQIHLKRSLASSPLLQLHRHQQWGHHAAADDPISSSSSSLQRLSSSSTLTSMSPPPCRTTTRLHMMDIVGVSPEPIHTAFSLATFGPQPFWLLMILFPQSTMTKKVMGTLDVVLFFCLLHLFIVTASIVQPDATAPLLEFNNVFDPQQDNQAAFMNMVTNYPNFVAEEWPHVLTWDLLVGRWIWLDGLNRGIFTSHSVLLANLIGPPGLLLHWLTCVITTGKGLTGEENYDKVIMEVEEGPE